jgi:uncharacterized membrane protein YczE
MDRTSAGPAGKVGRLGGQVVRWSQLMVGLFAFGLSIALMMRSHLGLGPWDAFHVGLHDLTGITVGTASILAGVVIVGGTWIFGERPAAGTAVNMVMIGVFLDLTLPYVPSAHGWAWGLAYFLSGIALCGVATGLYIAPGLGKGPRDGLAILLSERLHWPVRRVRTCIELGVLAAGWAMGGPIGVGTVIFSFLMGPSMQWGMQLFGLIPRKQGRSGLIFCRRILTSTGSER